MCDSIYIGNTQQTFNKIIGVNLSDLLRLLKNRQKQDSFAAHFEQHFKFTTSCTYLRKCMLFKVVNWINLIGAMKLFMKPKFNLCMEERRTILKKIDDKRVMVMKNNLEIYGYFRHKTTFRRFCLSTDDPA